MVRVRLGRPLRQLVESIHEAGALAIAHLNHAGRAANPKASGCVPEAPSASGDAREDRVRAVRLQPLGQKAGQRVRGRQLWH